MELPKNKKSKKINVTVVLLVLRPWKAPDVESHSSNSEIGISDGLMVMLGLYHVFNAHQH